MTEQHALEIEGLYAHGEYVKCYERAKNALSLCERNAAEPEIRCRMLLLAARSAYCVSRFDEALGLCAAAEDLLETNALSSTRRLHLIESTLIRANVFRRQGKLREALAIIDPFDAAADDLPPSLAVERLLIEGACRFYLNEPREAEESLESALGLAIRHADSRMKSRVLTMLGLVAQNKGLHEAALEYFDRAREICGAVADHYGEAAAALNAGILLYRSGRFSHAGLCIERSKAIFESIEWSIGVCRSLLALGNIAKCRGDFAAAMRCYREAERTADRQGFARERALACEFIGDVHFARGRHQAAEDFCRRGLDIAASIAPEGDVVAEANRRLAELCLSRGDVSGALSFLRKALRLSHRLGDKLEKGAILRCMGKAAFLLGNRKRGSALFGKAVSVLHGAGCDFELGKTHLAYADILIDGGNASNEAWSSAVEAGHIFGSIESESWKKAAGLCLDRVMARRGKRLAAGPVLQGGRGVVKIGFSPDYARHEGFVAVSEPMLRLWEQIHFAAGFDRPVLVTGETGTGKELVARLIHALSARAPHPFVALNCAAVPDHLFESEFFGHKRGCFTGALVDRIGLFEEADRGTLFLDEVGEITALQQVKLLRVLQEGRIRRVGENGERPVNVRIISATNQNLEEKLCKAALREDFYYRINAEHILVPPLRERSEDIVPLIGFCLCSNGNGRSVARIEQSALKSMQRYSWPGNVRELFAVIERIKHMSNGGVITLEMLPERIRKGHRGSQVCADGTRDDARSDASRRLRRALDLCGGNKSAAARWLGISRGTLYKEIKRSGLLDLINDRSSPIRVSSSASGSGRNFSA
ncbi:MAG: sigma 54-interacting transcriptional regulator [Candidatus Krumholzibacteria bacterium]|nr:sigma 54-interacting transcriptional regulator [Candidatus Krumholzibacteria bacterium]